ncbi:hypothetical protein [Fontivita pretiosa]|uniref:hypothetical protein n=1 Tax=Fontivita pretiosa TaxID=2989684 RepID=UPI003D17A8FB
MGIRETINEKPGMVVGVVAVVVVAALIVAFSWMRGSEAAPAAASGVAKSWYTVDDGKTWFADRADRIVPFQHQGKTAYRCYVWTADGGKTKFVSHLERLKPAVRAQYQDKDTIEPWQLIPGSEEVKPPLTGDSGWVDPASPQAMQIMTPRAPDGKGTPVPVPAE